MELLILDNIHSASDVITNSSSELFIIDGSKDVEVINNIVREYGGGFREPFKFDLKEYCEYMKSLTETQDYDHPLLGYCAPYSIASEWFYDENSGISVACYFAQNMYIYRHSKYSSIVEFMDELYDAIFHIQYDGEDVDKSLLDEVQKIALNYYKFLCSNFPELRIKAYDRIEYLDGKYLLITESDNCVDYDTIELLQAIFSCRRIHLG